jgi:hypothetical protein
MASQFLLQYVFNRNQRIHNVIMSFIKGKYIEDCDTELACKMANCELSIYILAYKYKVQNIRCTSDDANLAAENGKIMTLIYLQHEQQILCTSDGANLAASNGEIQILIYLRHAQQILCTQEGANLAATNRHQNTLIYLETEQNIVRCLSYREILTNLHNI